MSHDVSGRTNTKRERKLFLVFLNYLEESVTRHERSDIHNKDEREPFFDFFYSDNFYNFQIYLFFFK